MASRAEEPVLSLAEIVNRLDALVRAGKTGTLYVLTDSKHYVRIGIKQGRVIHCIFGKFKGEEALPHMAQIRSGKYSFSEDIVSGALPHLLPPTSELLRQLHTAALGGGRFGSSSQAEEAEALEVFARSYLSDDNEVGDGLLQSVSAPTADVPPSPPPPPPVVADAVQDFSALSVSGDRLYALVVRELALTLGPMADVVASDYELALKSAITRGQLRNVLLRLGEEIGDSKQADRFVNQLMDLFGES